MVVKDVFKFRSGAGLAVAVVLGRGERLRVGDLVSHGDTVWKVAGAGSRCNCPDATELSLVLRLESGPGADPMVGDSMQRVLA